MVVLLLITLLLTGCIGGGTSKSTYSVSGKVVDGEGVGVPDITLGFSEDYGIATTDSYGQWSKEGLNGNVTITPVKDGWIFEPRQVTKADSDVNFTGIKKAYPLTVLTIGEGTVDEEIVVSALSREYEYGTQVQLTAVPETSWRFSHWEGDLEGSTNPATIGVDSTKSVTAVFEMKYNVNINVKGEGSVEKKITGSMMKITAIETDGWYFDHWKGDLTGSKNPANIEMNDDKSVTAGSFYAYEQNRVMIKENQDVKRF